MNSSESKADQKIGEKNLFSGSNLSFVSGGGTAIALALSGNLLVGHIHSGSEFRRFIEAMLPTTQTLTFASITVFTTILNLMLTLIGFTSKIENEFAVFFYRRIKNIEFLSCITLIISILLLLSVQLQESDKIPVI